MEKRHSSLLIVLFWSVVFFGILKMVACVTSEHDRHLEYACERCWRRPVGKDMIVWVCGGTLRPEKDGGCRYAQE